MATRLSRRPDQAEIQKKVFRQFGMGYTLDQMAADNGITTHQVRGIISRIGKMEQDGIFFRRVKPYVCKVCKQSNVRTPATEYKPCVKCLAEGGK
jgi:hypothetical protein